MLCGCEATYDLRGFACEGLGHCWSKSGRRLGHVSVEDVSKAYEVLLAHGFKDMQIQQAMQVLSPVSQFSSVTQHDAGIDKYPSPLWYIPMDGLAMASLMHCLCKLTQLNSNKGHASGSMIHAPHSKQY